MSKDEGTRLSSPVLKKDGLSGWEFEFIKAVRKLLPSDLIKNGYLAQADDDGAVCSIILLSMAMGLYLRGRWLTCMMKTPSFVVRKPPVHYSICFNSKDEAIHNVPMFSFWMLDYYILDKSRRDKSSIIYDFKNKWNINAWQWAGAHEQTVVIASGQFGAYSIGQRSIGDHGWLRETGRPDNDQQI